MNANKKPERKKQKINKSVSFNAIKNMAFEIFFNEPDKNKIINKLTKLFLMNPIVLREDRQLLRKKISDIQSLNFQKRKKESMFFKCYFLNSMAMIPAFKPLNLKKLFALMLHLKATIIIKRFIFL